MATTDQIVAVPLVGRIAAGSPIFALEEAEAILPLPRALFHGSGLFALRVQGDSMIEAGIFNGDIAVLRSGPDFSDGDIAAVVVEEEATLKRIFKLMRNQANPILLIASIFSSGWQTVETTPFWRLSGRESWFFTHSIWIVRP